MRVSLITTIRNEEETIQKLLDSVLNQTKKPDEFIIVDGGSTDETISRIRSYESRIKNLKIIIKKGNRSMGRNTAIKLARNNIIACTDAGNVLDKNWIKEITQPFQVESVGVVAGYYKGKPETVFQRCIVPYVLVMPDKVNPSTFLPATRSIAFKKSAWEKVGGFHEAFSHNEDYVFAKKLKKTKQRIVFKKSAIVYWMPRKNIKQFFTMCFRFAYGDAEAEIYRTKVILIFARYLLGIFLVLYIILSKTYYLIPVTYYLLIIYFLWAFFKNYKYVKYWKAIVYLPLLQLTSDVAVIIGTMGGIIERLRKG